MSNAENLARIASALTADTSGNLTAQNTPAQFDVTKQLVTAEFLKRRGAEFTSHKLLAVGGALAASDVGNLVEFANISGNVSLSLPSVAAVPDGAVLHIFNNSGAGYTVTLNRIGSDVIDKQANAGTSLTLAAGDDVLLVGNGLSKWLMIGGSAALGQAGAFGASKTANGYQRLPGGLILQWGSFTASASADVAVTLPIAFPTATLTLNLTAAAAGGGVFAAYNSLTRFGFNGNAWSATATRNAANVQYLAVGW